MKNKPYLILLGLALIVLGITAVILQLVGVNWAFLELIEMGGRLFAFVVKVLMIMAGFFCVVIGKTDWERERKESE